MKVKKVLVSAFLLATCLMNVQAQRRNEIQVPDLDGYTTLKCDFHMHTVFSDGLVWPTVRVDEAYREGLDAISLTEHIEYRPHKKDVVADHNRSFDLCQKQAEKLGLPVPGALYVGGSADSAWTAMVGAPTLCGMGPQAVGAHSNNEYLFVPSMTERAQLLAMCIMHLDEMQ